MHQLRVAAGIVALCLGACSAGRPPVAFGPDSDVVVIAGGRVAPPALAATFESTLVHVAEPEPRFRLTWSTRFDAEARRGRNLLVLADLGAGGDAVRAARAAAGPRLEAAVAVAGGVVWVLRDAFASGQCVILVAARDARTLDSLVVDRAANLAAAFEAAVLDRLQRLYAGDPVAVARARRLGDQHGFALYAPADYETLPGRGTWPGAVELVRASPTRTITIFWLDGVDSAATRSQSFLLGLQRDAMWRLRGDVLADAGLAWSAARLGEAAAVRLVGLWQNRADVGGGVLRTYFLYDGERRRLYGVQAQLFAPGQRKSDFLHELEAIQRSFRLGGAT
jgi:hypothetical protein